VEQEEDPGKPGGFIRMEILRKNGEEQTYEEATVDRVAGIISGLLSEDYALEDIAVLCRKNHLASLVSRELILRDIPVISSESLLLGHSPEAGFITGMLKLLQEPTNTVVQASVAMYLFHSGKLNSETDLHALLEEISSARNPGEQVFRIMQRNGMDVNGETLLAFPLYDCCEEIIRKFGLDKQADPYIQFFLDSVITFTDKEPDSISGFLEWWEGHKEKISIVVPEGMDAVRTMTIHKAKGLEFPVVIYPFADEEVKKTDKYLWADISGYRDIPLQTALLPMEKLLLETPYGDDFENEQKQSMLDMVNLLYVAMTRPRERLYILTTTPPKSIDKLRSLPAVFAGYLQFREVYDEGKSLYEFGHPTAREGIEKSTSGEINLLTQMPSTNWRRRIRIKTRATGMWDMDHPRGVADYGERVHAVLARLQYGTDLEDVLERAILAGLISPDEQKRILEMGREVISHPVLERYYSKEVKVKTEPDILETTGELRRPDRVVFDGNEVVVIEYKTGKKYTEHKEQVKQYGKLMHEMGYPHVKLFLAYLSPVLEVEEI